MPLGVLQYISYFYTYLYIIFPALFCTLSFCHFFLTTLSSDRQLADNYYFALKLATCDLQHATCNAFLHHLPFNHTAKPFISWQRLIKWLFSFRSFKIKNAQPHCRCMCTILEGGMYVGKRNACKCTNYLLVRSCGGAALLVTAITNQQANAQCCRQHCSYTS